MAQHDVSLVRRETVAEGTMAFFFGKPTGFMHRAGQSLLLSLIDPPETDGEGDSRSFTIASAPHEPELMIATRMRDTAFKRVLGAAEPGMKLRIDGPHGEMVLHGDASRPAVFLAGGIGITPFLAMARQAAYEKLPHSLWLFYSNRKPEDSAFLAELQQIQAVNPRFRLVATMTDRMTDRGDRAERWTGETGFIGREMLERHLPGLHGPVYYFAGPPVMTTAMHEMLAGIGVDEPSMRYEEFYGY